MAMASMAAAIRYISGEVTHTFFLRTLLSSLEYFYSLRRPGVPPLDPATFKKVDETFSFRSP